jgi:hypothetical protein
VDVTGVSLVDWALVPLDASIPDMPEVSAAVGDLKAGVVAQYGDVYHTKVAYAPWDLKLTYDARHPWRDTAMGNFLTDALRFKTGTNLAVTANGLISEGIVKGWVVGADLFRPVSFGYDQATGLGFKLVTFDIVGAEIIKALEVGLAYLGVSEDYFLQVSGMKFTYDSRLAPGARVVLSTVKVGNKALNPTKTYTVTVNEGIAALLPLMGVQVSNLQVLPDLEYHVVWDHAHRLGVLPYLTLGRITDEAAKPRTRSLEVDAPTAEVQGGCSTARAPVAPLGLVLLLGLALALRRRR